MATTTLFDDPGDADNTASSTSATAAPTAASSSPKRSKRHLWSASDTYSTDQFYTRASDEKGHAAYSKVHRFEPAIYEQIKSLIEAKEYPAYKTFSDFVRDSLVHRLAWLRDNHSNPRVQEQMGQILRRIHVEEISDSYERELDHYTALNKRIKELCDKALSYNDISALQNYLDYLREEVDPLREPFRTQLNDLIDLYQQKL